MLATAALAWLAASESAESEERRYTIGFANLTEEPGATIEGTGFTGTDVRRSFALAARGQPVDLVLYDNRRDGAQALANAADAVRRKVDLYVHYFADPKVNREVVDLLRSAGIPVLVIGPAVDGAPSYGPDNRAAGRIGGEALARFAAGAWSGQPTIGIVIGHLGDQANGLPERAEGAREPLARAVSPSRVVLLDTRGDIGRVSSLLGKVAAAHPNTKLLVAAMDDQTALSAKAALEAQGRAADAAIVGMGTDHSVHGGLSDRKEIDPNNRGSILIGSVAFFLDRYGYDVVPLALRILRGEAAPARSRTRHLLITPANVWREYPPSDMQ